MSSRSTVAPAVRPFVAALAALSTAACVHAQTPQPHYLHVDASALPGGDGSDWLHAFRDLQDALAAVPANAAANGHRYEIRIAQGIYRPDRGTGDRNASFVVASAVSLVGGYGGLLAPNPDHLNSSLFVSVLSGDLLANDGPNSTNTADNSHHVVRLQSPPEQDQPSLSPNIRIRGLTVRSGNSLDATHRDGAGVVCEGISTDMYIYDCIFRDHRGQNGAAFASEGYHTCSFSSCRFENNSANDQGGAIFFGSSSLVQLWACTFTANSASTAGGAVLAADAWVYASTFSGNTAPRGAGLDLVGRGAIIKSRIVGNTATNSGGGASLANFTVLSTLIAHNSAPSGAGVRASGTVEIDHCTIVRNSASQSAGAVLVAASESPTRIRNSILWNNTSPSIKTVATITAPLSLDHCILQNGAAAISAPAGALTAAIITADPLFADPVGTTGAASAWADKDYRLTSGSPAIDAGLDASPELRKYSDLAEARRLNNSTCAAYARPDLGAYEFAGYICPSPRSITFVRASAPPGGDGVSWATAYRDLQDALAAPGVRDIWVSEGTYTPDRATGDRAARFRIEKPYVAIHGSFAGAEASLSQRTIAAHPTILSADLLHNDSTAPTSTLDNTAGLIEVDFSGSHTTSTTLSGLTVTATRASAADESGQSALRLSYASAAIFDCTFSNNSATAPTPTVSGIRPGAAIYAHYSSTIDLQRCAFINNAALHTGGAIDANIYSSFSASDCLFIGNTSASGGAVNVRGGPSTFSRCAFIANAAIDLGVVRGGALAINSYGSTIHSCRFLGNLAFAYPDSDVQFPEASGGAIFAAYNSLTPVVSNSLFAGNRCAGIGAKGAAVLCHSSLTIANSTFANNAASFSITSPGTSSIVQSGSWGSSVSNSIFWNSAPFGTIAQSPFGTTSFTIPQVFKCIIQGSTELGLDPLFTNPPGPDNIIGTADDDYSLLPSSPAIDAADASRLPSNTTLDLAGRARFFDAPNTPNTGTGTPNFLDIGAFEYAPIACLADFNSSNSVNSQDIFDFLSAWFARDPRADINGNGHAPSDILDFISAWFTGC